MDVHDPARGVFGRYEPQISNDACDALLEGVMTTEPYASAQRVFWVVDDRTIHRDPGTPRGSSRSRSPSPRDPQCPVA
jgi:hypothetical protein